MSQELASLEEAASVVEDIAEEYLQAVRDSVTNAGENITASEIAYITSGSDVRWDFVLDVSGTQYERDESEVVSVTFEVADSREYEGEDLGYNVSVKAVWGDGLIAADITPHNYTPDVWTKDREELVERAENIRQLRVEDILD